MTLLERRLLVALFFVCSFAGNAIGQEDNGSPVPQPVPPSPNAASLGRYGEIPVSMYTGVPEISIPLWNITEGEIHVPVSASYHASGVRVEENASWVGLGWSLNAGGVITRTVRGKVDELGYFYYPGNKKIPGLLLNPHNSTPSDCDVWDAAQYAYYVGQPGSYDSEPDAYFFNFNGISGKFVFDQDGVPYTVPFQKLKIEKLSTVEWLITTPDGIKYRFGTTGYVEYSDVYSVTYSYYGASVSSKNKVGMYPLYQSAWYLKEIESPTGNKVFFDYAAEDYEVNSGISQQLYYNTTSTQGSSYSPSNSSILTSYKGLRLSSIRFSAGKLNFVANKTREDLSLNGGNPNANALEEIDVIDMNNITKRKFLFNTDYFQSSDVIQNATTKRLRLNSILETSGDGLISKPPHVFTYDNTFNLPAKNSSSQDHWGYFNGKNNFDNQGHPTLIPAITTNYFSSIYVDQSYTGSSFQSTPIIQCPGANSTCNIVSPTIRTFQYQGANRNPDFIAAKTGILTKIQYPTGGNTEFEYEPHDYDLKNYIYKKVSSSINALASCSDPAHPSTHIGDQCYVNPTITPNQIIPANLQSLNPDVPFSFLIAFNLDGNDNKCCKCGSPFALFTDVTTNTVLLRIDGFGGLQLTDQIIQSQISGGFASYTHINGSTVYQFDNVILNSSHTYELRLYGRTCPPENCQEFPNCPNREYRMEAYGTAGFQYRTNIVEEYNGTVGGIRIKKIISSSSANDNTPLIKQYVYRLTDPGEEPKSSGVIIDNPVYFDQQTVSQAVIGARAFKNQVVPTVISNQTFNVYVLTSGSKFEIGQTNGSYVGYREVQEIYCPDRNCNTNPIGKKLFKFTSSDDYNDINSGVFGAIYFDQLNPTCPVSNPSSNKFFNIWYTTPAQVNPFDHIYPYPTKTSYDWKRGLLMSESTFDNNGSLVKKIENLYNPVADNSNRKVISALKIIHAPLGDANYTKYHLFFGRYDIIAAWNYLNQEKITEKQRNGDQIVTTRSFFYDNPQHAQLTRIEYFDSKGNLIKELKKYPGDNISSTTPGESNAIADLQAENRINTVIENEVYNNSNLVSQIHNVYDMYNNTPLIHLGNKKNGTQPSYTNFIIHQYDQQGRVLELELQSGIRKSFIYDYKSSYPTAETVNASVNDIACNSFEADGAGGWSFTATGITGVVNGITGNKSYWVSAGTISRSGLNQANTYTLSFWVKTGETVSVAGTTAPVAGVQKNGWTYYSATTTPGINSVTISGSGHIDELRLYPKAAQMTTFTYEPLIGMTSQCDAGNHITYYNYDALGRLLRIRDQDNNILKTFDYKYQQQP